MDSQAPSRNRRADMENALDAGAAARKAGTAALANERVEARAASARVDEPATWRRARIADMAARAHTATNEK